MLFAAPPWVCDLTQFSNSPAGSAGSACKAIRNLRIVEDVERAPVTVVEIDRFLKDAKHLMPESERFKLVVFHRGESAGRRPDSRDRRSTETAVGTSRQR